MTRPEGDTTAGETHDGGEGTVPAPRVPVRDAVVRPDLGIDTIASSHHSARLGLGPAALGKLRDDVAGDFRARAEQWGAANPDMPFEG